MKRVFAALLLCLCATATADDTADNVDAEIEQLLAFVSASGCDFERNGTVHDSEGAAAHMRLKLSNGKRYVKTAEDFIDRLASASSWTGRDYYAICSGERIKSRDWLYGALEEQRQTTARN